jgi:anti-anti-sigma factor
MVVNVEQDGDVCILRLEGRFATGLDSEYLRGKIEELKDAQFQKIIADFRNVSYIDSTGIGFLIGVYTSVLNKKGQFALAGINHRVREVLQLTKLDGVLPAYENVSAAKSAFAGPHA